MKTNTRTRTNMRELRRLAELGKTSGGFLHDMVNHVTAVTLSMNYIEQRVAKDSEMLRQHAEQTARMRKSIEDFAHGVRGYMKSGNAPCFFQPLNEIATVVELFRYRADAEHITISVSGNSELRLYGNRLRFGQIISNILSNAIDAIDAIESRATTRARNVSIVCEQCGAHVKISITDTGDGIPEHVRHQLFMPFVSTKQDRGTGLGLVSVKKIIEEDFSGAVEIETTPGEGTTFSLLFRTKIGGAADTAARATSPQTTSR